MHDWHLMCDTILQATGLGDLLQMQKGVLGPAAMTHMLTTQLTCCDCFSSSCSNHQLLLKMKLHSYPRLLQLILHDCHD